MAKLNPIQAKLSGVAVAMAAASVSGDTIDGSDAVALLVTNGSGSSINVTIVVPGNTEFGQAEPDVVIAVPATSTKLIGPLPAVLEDRATDRLVHITYSAVTTVTVAALKI